MKKYKPYIYSVLIALAVGGLSALFTLDGFGIYDIIASPPLSPPPIVFPIVWTVLYILMGTSAAIVFTSGQASYDKRTQALKSYGLSLILNFFWSIIFFKLGAFFFAFVWLLALLATVVRTVLEYREIDRLAAVLQIPYLLWLLFAAYLSAGVWILNG